MTPVGTVWFAWAVKRPTPRCIQTSAFTLDGDRDAIRARAVRIALEGVLQLVGP
jgi:nicotinamide-nucleotide amidase